MTTTFEELNKKIIEQADFLYNISGDLEDLNDLAQQKDLSSEELLEAGATFVELYEAIDNLQVINRSELFTVTEALHAAIVKAGELPEPQKVSFDIETTAPNQQIAHKSELPDVDDMTPEQITKELVERLTAMLSGGSHPPLLTTAPEGTKRQYGWPHAVHTDVAQFPFPEKLFAAMKKSVIAAAVDVDDLGNFPEVIQLRDEYLEANKINKYSASLILMTLISLTMHPDAELQCLHCVLEKIAESAKIGDEHSCQGMIMTLWGHMLTRTEYSYFDKPDGCEDKSIDEMRDVKLSFFDGEIEEAAQALIFNVSQGVFSTPPLLDRAYIVNFFDVPV